MNIRRRVVGMMMVVGCFLTGTAVAQDKSKGKAKSYTFQGKVEAVTTKGLTVNGEKVEGWMEAMTMSYPVDKPEALKMIKVGDRIMATVYDGDITLHDVMVMPAETSDKQKK